MNSQLRSLGLVLPSGFEYSRSIQAGVIEALETCSDWQVLELPYCNSGTSPSLSGLEQFDGLIVWLDRQHQWLEEVVKTGTHVVNCGGDWRDVDKVSCVAIDMHSVLKLLVNHCMELTLERMVFFGMQDSDGSHRAQLIDALAELARPYGIEVSFIELAREEAQAVPAWFLSSALLDQLGEQLLGLERPACIVCEDDYYARLICRAAILSGLRIPADFAVIGAGDNLIGRFGAPSLSTVSFPGKEIGLEAFRVLVESCENGVQGSYDLRIEAHQLIVRESSGGRLHDLGLERVFRHIERNALGGLTVRELPQIGGMSSKVLRRRYLEAYHEEPSKHIRRLRLNEAIHLLKASDEPISHIASACGFSSQAGFYNYFHRHLGIAPQAYRENHQSA